MAAAVVMGADLADQGLGAGGSHRAGFEQQIDLALHGGIQRIGRHHLMQQADAQGFRGIENFGGGEIAARLSRTDGSDDIRRNHCGQQAQLAFGQAKFGIRHANSDITAGHQAHATAKRCPLYTGDGGLGQLVQGAHQLRQRQ